MKKSIFKWSYIAAAVLISVLVFAFSVTALSDGRYNYKKSANFDTEKAYASVVEISRETRPRNSAAHIRSLSYINGELLSYGVTPVTMQYNCTYDDTVAWGGYGGSYTLIPDTKVTNILVEFPGTESQDIVLVQAHTDSVPMGAGAYDDAVPVSSMMEIIRQIKSKNMSFKNSVVFLFTDGEEEGLLGARMFAEKRPVINNIDSRYVNLADNVKFVTNWEARGTGGTLIMFETTKGNYNTVKNFAKINRKVYTNSVANFVYNQMPNGTDFSAFSGKGIQGLNFANIGEGYNYHTGDDSIDNIDKSNIALNGETMLNCLNHFGNMNLAGLYTAKDNAVFFSWLNLFTVSYPVAVVIAFAVITLLLIAGTAVVNIKLKKYSFKQLGLALASNTAALVCAVLAAFLFKAVFGLIPAFGRLLGSASFNNKTAVFGYLFLMLGVYAVVSALFNKLFKIKNPEYNMLAQCLFMAVLGALLSFIMPELSVVLAPSGFVAAIIIAVSASVPKYEMKALYLGFVPFVVMLPIAVSLTLLAADALGLTLGWITAAVTLFAFGYVIPYLLNARLFIKEKIQNRETDKKAVKVLKTAAHKSNYVVSVISVILGLGLLLGLLASPLTVSTNIYGKASGRYMLFVDDAIIYRQNIDETDGRFVMYDKSAYEYISKRYGITSVYDSEIKGYALNLTGAVNTGAPEVRTVKQSGYFEIDVKKAESGAFSLYFPLDADKSTPITKIEVTDAYGTYVFMKEDFINNMTNAGEIKFRSYSDSLVKIYTGGDTLKFRYVENSDFAFLNITKINEMTAAEKNLKTGVELYKEFNI